MTAVNYEDLSAQVEMAEDKMEMAQTEVVEAEIELEILRSDPESEAWDIEDAEDVYKDAKKRFDEKNRAFEVLNEQWGEANRRRAQVAISHENGKTEIDSEEITTSNSSYETSISIRKREIDVLKESVRNDMDKIRALEEVIERDMRAGQAVNRYEAISDKIGRWEVIVNRKGNFELREPIENSDSDHTHAHVITVVGDRSDLVERFFQHGCGFDADAVEELIQIATDIESIPEVEPVQEDDDENHATTEGSGARAKPYKERATNRAKELKEAGFTNKEIADVLASEGMEYSQSGVYSLLKNA